MKSRHPDERGRGVLELLVELRGVRAAYGDVQVLRPTDLQIEDGEFLTILGPSGSGKTTILRLLGGFLEPSGGEILLDGKDITRVAAEARPFNTVFQDYALFPHMSVGENVAYSAKVRGEPRSRRLVLARDALDLVGLQGLEGRKISQLSGGQRQRVALARAIVAKPRLILLDEPLSALDAGLRLQMQMFLKSIQRSLGTTFVFVTHDQAEALALSDRIVVMQSGAIVQIGTGPELYERPNSHFIATFIGRNNVLPVAPAANGRRVDTPLGTIDAEIAASRNHAAYMAIRPERVRLASHPPVAAPGYLGFPVRVVSLTYAGTHLALHVASEASPESVLEVFAPTETDAVVGAMMGATVALRDIVWLDSPR